MTLEPALPFKGDTIPRFASDTEDQKTLTVLTFTLGQQVLAVDVHCVREILDGTEIKPLPGAPGDVLGMIDLRGQGICIVDLAQRLGTHPDHREDRRIVVFEFREKDSASSIGILADRVLRVCETQPEKIEPIPETFSAWRCEAATGMLRTEDGIALLLDINRILNPALGRGDFDFS